MAMSFLPASWTGAEAGLHHNDQVLRFDGIEFRGSHGLYGYAPGEPQGRPIRYLLQSPTDKLERITVPTMRLEWPDFVKLFLLADLLGGSLLLFCSILFGLKPDHAVQAAAALRAREALAPLFEAWAKKGFSLGLGVGISSGLATCGYVGFEGRREYTALGKVVNTAARLCDSADPGQILATLRTVTATGTAFRWEPVGVAFAQGAGRAGAHL